MPDDPDVIPDGWLATDHPNRTSRLAARMIALRREFGSRPLLENSTAYRSSQCHIFAPVLAGLDGGFGIVSGLVGWVFGDGCRPLCGVGGRCRDLLGTCVFLVVRLHWVLMESLILAQDERWRRA